MGNRIVIIGAGVAGLTAGRALARAGARVVVLEQEERLGGLARTLERDGRRCDLGPHRLHTELPEAQAIYDEFAPAEQIETRRQSRMWLDGRFYRYPPSPLEFALLRPGLAARFAFGLLAARRAPTPAGEPASLATALRASWGRPLYEYFFAPYIAKVWKSPLEALSADIARLRVATGRGGLTAALRPPTVGRVRYLRGGIEALPARLARDMVAAGGELRTGLRAVGIETEGRRARAVVAEGPGGPARLEADVVLSTAPAPDLVGWLTRSRPDADAQEAARRLRFLRMVFVNVLTRRPPSPPAHWLYFPEPSPRFNRAHEPARFDPAMARGGGSMLCVEYTGRPDSESPDAWTQSDDALIEETVGALAAAGVVRRGDVEGAYAHRLDYAYPLYTIDYRRALEPALDFMSWFENVVSFGRQGRFCHNNLDHSLVMGLRAAEAAQSPHPAAAFRARDAEFRAFRIVD